MRAFVEAMPPHTDLLMAELNYLEAHPPPSCQHGVAVDVLDAEGMAWERRVTILRERLRDNLPERDNGAQARIPVVHTVPNSTE